MNEGITTSEARSWVKVLRLEQLHQKRAFGDPRAPMRARPGYEELFEKASADIAFSDFLLRLLEKEERRERSEALLRLKRKTVKTADKLLDRAIIFGLASAAMLGIAASAVLFKFPDAVVRATALVGVGTALALAAARK